MTLGYQHDFRKYPDLPERCIICARLRTPENEQLECVKPEPPLSREYMARLVSVAQLRDYVEFAGGK